MENGTFAPQEKYYGKWNICSSGEILWKMEHLLLRRNIMENGTFAPQEKYYGKWNICSSGANILFFIIFSKILHFKGVHPKGLVWS